MKPWLRFSSLVLFSLVVAGGLFLSGVQQFAPEEAKADVVTSPWPTSATTGTHLMVVSMTASSTWIAPDGVSSVIVEAWGAGGAARPTTADACGGGGGYARSLVSVTPGSAYWIQVGGHSPAATSTFATTTVVAAPGWSWTNGGSGGAAASSTGDVKYSGGHGLAATSDRGASAGDQVGITGAGAEGVDTNGAPPGSNTNLVQSVPGGSGCDVGDLGARGLVRLTYSSTTLAGFPYVRARNWRRFVSYTPTVYVPTSTQADDVLLAYVVYGVLIGTGDQKITCLSNCGGWSIVFATTTNFGGATLFKKSATSSVGNNFVVTSTQTGTSPLQSYFVLSVANADVDQVFSATSSAPTASYGDPPNLDTGVSQKYLWLNGSSSGGNVTTITPFCVQQGSTGTLALPVQGRSYGKNIVWWEEFKEQSSYDPNPIPELPTTFCTGSASRDWLAFTVAIAGLAAEEEPAGTTVNTATPSTGWSGGFSTWFNNNF